ncbi:MAG TPA: SpoIVB peptidase S55 domain-containing protein [Pyrinomonadaceae bacterium]|nr:SpoIVB peptidase S55 domain-containing protein [Pyrinomonadaceae bacterium]
MKQLSKALLIVIAVAILSSLALAQKPVADLVPTETKLFPLEDLRPGMKGTARTVFSGSEPQDFNVEILGVLPGAPGPRQSIIIAKLSGANVEKTGVFAGMSGSPVYVDNRLVGAIAYSFPFSREPIAGITPIKQMIEIFEKGSVNRSQPAKEPKAVSFAQLASTDWKPTLPKQAVSSTSLIAPVSAGSPLIPLLGQQMTPIATPIVFGGISQESLSMFAPQLVANGLLPVSGVGGSGGMTPLAKATEQTLTPGRSISVQLVRGDYSIAASGTVTLRDNHQIYAFGHPFLSLGASDMPMSETAVVTVIPNVNNSFKLSVPGAMMGSISQDRSAGVFGQLGQAPKMIPVKINLHTSRDRSETFSYEIANDTFLTPLLLNITVFNTITSSERAMGESTITIKGAINVKGQETIELDRRFSAGNSPILAAGSVAGPVSSLLGSGFDDVQIEGVTLDISSTDTKYAGTLERIALNKTEARRGEKIEIQAFVRTESGKQFVQRIPLQIPEDATPGQLLVFVGDGGALQEGSTARSFVPQDLGQLVKAINKVKKSDRLYVKLFRITPGAVIGTNELPNLPPSMVATLNSDRNSGGYTPTVLSAVSEMELPPAEFVISGQQLIALDIVP